MEPYVPPPLREGYLRRFATYLAMFLIAIAIGFSVQIWQAGSATAFSEDNLWMMARVVAGVVVLSALFACLRNTKAE